MDKKLLILITTLMLFFSSYCGCVEQPKSKIEITLDTQETKDSINLIVNSFESNKKYDWNEINISFTSQYINPHYIVKEGEISVGDVIEIPSFIFEQLSKIYVRMRLNSSYILLWGDIVYAPFPTPKINFTLEDNKMIVDSIDKVDYEWDFDVSLINDTYIVTDELVFPNKIIEVGDIIDLNEYEIYEIVEIKLTYNPTNEIVANLTLDLIELDPKIYLTVDEIEVDDLVYSTYFYIYSGKSTFGTKDIIWNIKSDIPSWMIVEPMSGVFKYGTQRVNITFSNSELAAGKYTHTINITSNYGYEDLNIILNKL